MPADMLFLSFTLLCHLDLKESWEKHSLTNLSSVRLPAFEFAFVFFLFQLELMSPFYLFRNCLL